MFFITLIAAALFAVAEEGCAEVIPGPCQYRFRCADCHTKQVYTNFWNKCIIRNVTCPRYCNFDTNDCSFTPSDGCMTTKTTSTTTTPSTIPSTTTSTSTPSTSTTPSKPPSATTSTTTKSTTTTSTTTTSTTTTSSTTTTTTTTKT